MEDVFSPVAGDEPQNGRSSVDFEPPSAEWLKQNSLVLFLNRNQSFTVLCNEGDILVVVCRSTGSVCVPLQACVDVSVCSQEGKSTVWMVCRPCAGLWGVDCGVLNHGLLMLLPWDLALCSTVFVLSHSVSSSISSFFPVFSFSDSSYFFFSFFVSLSEFPV